MNQELDVSMRAGAHSSQTINVGLTASEAHTIIEDRIAKEFSEFQRSSIDILGSRLREFENSLVSRLVKAGKLDAAGDPNLWGAIQAAAVQAAGSDDERDIGFLVDLLIERVDEPADRRRRTVIDGAIRAITSLDVETLAGISTLYAVTELNPRFAHPGSHLRMMDKLVATLNPIGLPLSQEWVEHAINIGAASSTLGLRPFRDYLNARFAWCLAPGVADDSEELYAALSVSSQVGWQGLSRNHPYRPGFSVTPWSSSEDLVTFMTQRHVSHEEAVRISNAMKSAWGMGTIHPEAARGFEAELDALDHLKAFGTWMAALRPPIVLTSVGKMVGYVNIKRLAPTYVQKNVLLVG